MRKILILASLLLVQTASAAYANPPVRVEVEGADAKVLSSKCEIVIRKSGDQQTYKCNISASVSLPIAWAHALMVTDALLAEKSKRSCCNSSFTKYRKPDMFVWSQRGSKVSVYAKVRFPRINPKTMPELASMGQSRVCKIALWFYPKTGKE